MLEEASLLIPVIELHNLIWPTLMDGCVLTTDTETLIKNAGEWEDAGIGPNPQDGYFEALPHTMGRLVKAS
jgi:hypothetical protein